TREGGPSWPSRRSIRTSTRRIEQLGRDIDALRARHLADPADAAELADLEARPADLRHRLTDLEAHAKPRHDVADALEAELEGLVVWLNGWIAGQSAKARRNEPDRSPQPLSKRG